MTDQVTGFNPAVPTPDPGQGQNVPPDAGQGQGTGQDTPLTRAEIQQMFSQFGESLQGELRKFRQSTTDRVEDRVRRQIETQNQALQRNAQMLRQMNVNVTDDMVRQAQQDIYRNALVYGLDGGEDFGDPAQGAAQQPPTLDIDTRARNAYQQATQYAEQYGVMLTQRDQEYVDPRQYNTPEEWLSAHKAALDRKAARLGLTQQPPQQPPQQPQYQGSPAARLTGLGGGSPAADAVGQMVARAQFLQGKPGKTQAEWKEMHDLAKQIKASLPKTRK